MKIIDERGKLLGLVNIIDFLIILGILLIAAGAVYKILGPPAIATPEKTIKIEVLVSSINKEMADMVHTGDQLVAGNNYIPAYITKVKVEKAELANNKDNIAGLVGKHPFLKDLYVTIEGKTRVDRPVIKLATQEIRVGKTFYLKSKLFEFTGIIIGISF